MEKLELKDGLVKIELKNVKAINIKKVNITGCRASSQEVDIKIIQEEMYQIYIELQRMFGGLLF